METFPFRAIGPAQVHGPCAVSVAPPWSVRELFVNPEPLSQSVPLPPMLTGAVAPKAYGLFGLR